MRRPLLLLAALLALPAAARADGKFFAGDRVPPDLPYQRALLRFDGAEETLLLQSKYEGQGPVVDFGWVVPVPAVPEVGSVAPHVATDLFRALASNCEPRVLRVGPAVFLTLLVSGLVATVAVLFAAATGVVPWLDERRRPLSALALALLVLGVGTGLTILPGGESMSAGVEVLASGTAGVYDYSVVRAEDEGGLVAWLSERGFSASRADRVAIADYLARGWCFVAAKISPGRTEAEAVSFRGLVAPLILRFPTERAVYPLALTAVAGTETEVLLYVLAGRRMDAGKRLEAMYAGRLSRWTRNLLGTLRTKVEPEGFLGAHPFPEDWLMKLRARLTPEEMREDLVLTPSAESGTLEQTRYRW
ncbi:MAG: DUF2330 domain-containing protein [Planctomycetota bacterium]|jgi:hypothetical protein